MAETAAAAAKEAKAHFLFISITGTANIIPASAGAAYVATGINAVESIITTDKEAVAFFVLFFGYYPILKQAIEAHIKNKWLQLLIKILCFSAAAVATYFIAIYLLGISSEEFTVFGINLPIIFLLAGIIVFVIFDNALSGLIAGYVNRLRQKIFGNIKSNTKL